MTTAPKYLVCEVHPDGPYDVEVLINHETDDLGGAENVRDLLDREPTGITPREHVIYERK